MCHLHKASLEIIRVPHGALKVLLHKTAPWGSSTTGTWQCNNFIQETLLLIDGSAMSGHLSLTAATNLKLFQFKTNNTRHCTVRTGLSSTHRSVGTFVLPNAGLNLKMNQPHESLPLAIKSKLGGGKITEYVISPAEILKCHKVVIEVAQYSVIESQNATLESRHNDFHCKYRRRCLSSCINYFN